MVHEVGALRVDIAREPRLELVQRFPAVRDLVLLALVHLRIRRALVFEARVPTWLPCC
jgi:hypothetical protein